MSEAERFEIEKDMAFHSAPTLLGVKCANLISFDRSEDIMAEYLDTITEKLDEIGLRALQLCKCRKRTLVYVYNRKMLTAWLDMPQVSRFLTEYGYAGSMNLEEKLDILAGRMICGSFPHEIGAFLGYPVEDIRGFINNSGKNCLLCGYWKVYGNAEKAQQTFKTYDRCRDILFDRLNQGLDLFRTIKYQEEFL